MKQMAQAFFGTRADLYHSLSIFRIKGIENYVLRCFGGRLTLFSRVTGAEILPYLKTQMQSVCQVTGQTDDHRDHPFVSSLFRIVGSWPNNRKFIISLF